MYFFLYEKFVNNKVYFKILRCVMICNDNIILSSKINWNLIVLNKGILIQLIFFNLKVICFFLKIEKNYCNMYRDNCFLKFYELFLRFLYIVCMDINFLFNF